MHRQKDRALVQGVDALPAPFRAVRRGIKEEISPRVAEMLNPDAMYLLGISFDLEVFHPDLLFLVVAPVSLERVEGYYREHMGEDFHEGELQAVKALPDEPALIRILSSADWIPSGQASLIRSVEFIREFGKESGRAFGDVVGLLSAGRAFRATT